MPWIQLFVDAPADETPFIEDGLLRAGALSVTLLNQGAPPLYEPGPGEVPLWKWTRVIGLFSDSDSPDAIKKRVLSGFAKHPKLQSEHQQLHHEILEDQDWERVWLDQFKPMLFGKSLWVGPVQEDWQGEGIYLHLDPGLAFGTGTHPTTALCLEWLASAPWGKGLVVDYGCGSGILAIAACKLGACHLIAVDHDPQALTATKDNAVKNQVQTKIEVILPGAYQSVQADLLMANILANPLISLAPVFADSVRPGGHVLLSGVLAHQANGVLAAYQPWFDMELPVEEDGWVRIVGIKRPV